MFGFVSFEEETFLFSIEFSVRDFLIGFSFKIDVGRTICVCAGRIVPSKIVIIRFSVEHQILHEICLLFELAAQHSDRTSMSLFT